MPSDRFVKYSAQKRQAKNRGISFRISFDDWCGVWDASGHWHERGRRKGEFCMARYGDRGAYEVGNVRIITVTENIREKVISKRTRKKIGLLKVGNKFTLGRAHTPEARAKMSLARIGNKNGIGNKNALGCIRSAETKAKMSQARELWWAQRRAA